MLVSPTVGMTLTKGAKSGPMMVGSKSGPMMVGSKSSPVMMGAPYAPRMGASGGCSLTRGMRSETRGLSRRSTAIAALGRLTAVGGALGLSRRALGLQYPSGLLVASFGAPGDEPDSFLSEEMKDDAFRTRRELETKYTSKDEEEGGRLKFEESQLGNLEVFAEEEPQEYEEEVKERKERRKGKEAK